MFFVGAEKNSKNVALKINKRPPQDFVGGGLLMQYRCGACGGRDISTKNVRLYNWGMAWKHIPRVTLAVDLHLPMCVCGNVIIPGESIEAVDKALAYSAIFWILQSVSMNTRLVEEKDPESGVTSTLIVTKKKPDISWHEYDRVVHSILEDVCSDYVIAEDYGVT